MSWRADADVEARARALARALLRGGMPRPTVRPAPTRPRPPALPADAVTEAAAVARLLRSARSWFAQAGLPEDRQLLWLHVVTGRAVAWCRAGGNRPDDLELVAMAGRAVHARKTEIVEALDPEHEAYEALCDEVSRRRSPWELPGWVVYPPADWTVESAATVEGVSCCR